MAAGHVVWDWNGTLLDDHHIVVEAANRSLALFAVDPLTVEEYRNHYTRPVQRFYSSVLGRDVTEDEWHRIDDVFHRSYYELAATARLAADALAAMDLLEEAGWTQSLLSMSPQHRLDEMLTHHRLADRFALTNGLTGAMGGEKAPYLRTHLDQLEIEGTVVVAIGDTPDDAAAAWSVGASAVLVDGGSHHRSALEASGVPVVSSLLDAARAVVET